MTGHSAPDLEPAEGEIDRMLAAITPEPPPLGFREAVLRRIAADRRFADEWPIALALAVPSLAYLLWAVALNGADIALALQNVFVLAAGTGDEDAFFFVDGLLVLAFALLGIAALVGSHALATPATDARR